MNNISPIDGRYQKKLDEFIETMPDKIQEELKKLSLENYIGMIVLE